MSAASSSSVFTPELMIAVILDLGHAFAGTQTSLVGI
jgi:hypothetical protein